MKKILNFLKNIYNINDENLMNYCIQQLPYLTFSEISKYKVKKNGLY